MSRSYELDAGAAAKAGTSAYISETGKYVGKLTTAESITSKKGTEGVEFAFQSDDGLSANYLQLWTYNTDGKQLYGFGVLSAIMTCLRVKNIAPKTINVTDYQGTRSAQGFPELCAKPIGLLLQKEEYLKSNGETGFKFNIVAPFDAKSEMTAGEILKQATSAEQLPRMVANLKDRPMQARATAAPVNGSTGDGGNWTEDSDIPFANPYRGKLSYVV